MQRDAVDLLRAEHAVAHVLAEAADEQSARPRLLPAIGEPLGWHAGALWLTEDGELRRVQTWPAGAPLETLSGQLCVPIRGATEVLGAVEFLAPHLDRNLLETMASLGGRIGQCVERWRSEQRLRDGDARKSAILNAAFDCIVTMDADGCVVEVNRATERTFGYSASEMVGRELAELIVPPALREAHRRGVQRYVSTGQGRLVGHPVELPAMRKDGSEFPVEIAITRPELEGPPQFTGYLRDVTERVRNEQALRTLAEEQAALRRVATVVASEADPERVFGVVTEEVGRLLGANTANMLRFEPDGTGIVVGAWSTAGVRAVPVGTHSPLDSPTVATRIRDSGRAERVDSFEGMPGQTAEMLRAIGLRGGVGAPIKLAGRLWGAVIASTAEDPFHPGAEQRVSDFAELVALALANAEAREQLAASRARIVEAGDAERRRLERNLHDGAQQRLVALALTLRLCDAKLGSVADPEARELIQQANAELAAALEELRELARGIHPAILTDRGLLPALEMLAARPSVPVDLSASLEDRLPQPVEAAAYYIVAEALTNASKYANASHVRVQVRQVNGAALVEVADDGVGGADEGGGSGLRGLCDRVEALGGTLDVLSPPGAGTTLRARIPCHSG
jgi:PAS domain S-box-containing protein